MLNFSIVNQKDGERGLAELCFILDDCLQHFPEIQTLRKKQEICLVNLARGKDVFATLPTGFGMEYTTRKTINSLSRKQLYI